MEHLSHLIQFDGLLHWCISLAIITFVLGILWVLVRVLMPLHRLVKQTEAIMEGQLPSFDQPISGIREIEKLQKSLRFMIDQIKAAQERENAYRNALTDSQENERLRLAREIHDDTIQSLVVVGHSIEAAAYSSTPPTMQHLKEARKQLMLTIDGLRQLIANLRPTVLDDLGLVTALEMLCEKYPRLSVTVVGERYPLERAQELAIFRVAQEAVCNAERHAQATQVQVKLTYQAARLQLTVQDNGAGFCVPKQLQEFVTGGHYGLMGMRERITHLGGQLELRSAPQQGTCVTVSVPIAAELPSAAAQRAA